MRYPRRLRPLVLLGVALLLYVPMLGRRDIVTGPEARVPLTAREMARTWPWQDADADRLHVPRVVLTDAGGGVKRLYPAPDGSTVAVNPWLVPVLQGLIRLQKPPLPYWCAAVLLKVFAAGQISQFWARLFPGLMGAFAVLLIYGLGRLTIGRVGAWAAGLVWISSYLPFEEYRLAMPDPYLAFFTLVCVWGWVRAAAASRGDAETLAMADAETLPNADAETRRRGDAVTGAMPDAETLPNADAETLPNADAETRRRGDAVTLPNADAETRRRGDAVTGATPDAEDRPGNQAGCPRVSASPHPRVNSRMAPRVSASPRLRVSNRMPPRVNNRMPSRIMALLVFFYLSLALGVLAKGPLIFVHVGIALAAFHICHAERLPGRAWQHLIGLVLMLAVAAPWFVYVYRQVPDAVAIWQYESVGEISNNRENVRAWWFYAPAALQISLPWTPVWAAGLVLPIRRFLRRGKPRDRAALFPIIWYLATLIFFSLVHQKKNPYLLPMLPAQVLLTAQALVALLGRARLIWGRRGAVSPPARSSPSPGTPGEGWGEGLESAPTEDPALSRSTGRGNSRPQEQRNTGAVSPFSTYLLGAQAVAGAIFAVVLVVVLHREHSTAPLWLIVSVSLAGLVAGMLPLWLLLRRSRQWLTAQAIGYALLVLLVFEGVITPRDNRRSARVVCDAAVQLLRQPGTTLLTNVGDAQGYKPMLAEEAAVYLPQGVGNRPGRHVLLIFDDQDGVAARKKAGKYAAYIPGPVPPVEGPVDEVYLRKWDSWIGEGRITEARRVPVPGAEGDVRWKLFELVVDRKMYAGMRDPTFHLSILSYILSPSWRVISLPAGPGSLGAMWSTGCWPTAMRLPRMTAFRLGRGAT